LRKKLRIGINAQLLPNGSAGGIITALRALTAVAHLEGDTEEYVFIGPYGDPEWLRPLLPTGQEIVRGPMPVPSRVERFEPLKRAFGPFRLAARNLKRKLNAPIAAIAGQDRPAANRFSQSNFYESLGCDVIHFSFQSFEPCNVPAVYNPHDLQHLHYPNFFRTRERTRRERVYSAACRAAHTVVVASEFVKRDVIQLYAIRPDKVQVIPWSPPPVSEYALDRHDNLLSLKHKYGLDIESPFVLYPANTWEHKNHLKLLDALALLRDRDGFEGNLVCTGYKTEFWPHIKHRIVELGLKRQVRFLGHIPGNELSLLYSAAQFVFIPTLFEAASAPLFEAWQHGAPVACSAVTSLPEQAGDAALLFDSFSVEKIAAALSRMANDEILRAQLKQNGERRLNDFSLELTAKAYRAVYRRAAGRCLNEEDRQLLAHDWTRRRASISRQSFNY
jgi:glycosyltransferase involved in cell wall biosynthesis